MEDKPKSKKAVALTYRPEKDAAPIVTASGKGKVAEQIIETARQYGIPVQDDPDLVEVLSKLDIEAEIPPSIYVVVAELLAFVYSVNGQNAPP